MPEPQLDFFADEVETLERVVRSQRPLEATHYDDDYFAEDWREDDNRYDLASRRRIEAQNPSLIRDFLRPTSVLDVGCGPGFLMLFLHELGLHSDGVDFSPSSHNLAPESIRDRIRIGPVDNLAEADASYDLVVCREVMEHLTVLQIRRTVAEICRVSSRLAYVTTRFNPAPASLLEITTDFETDPTHITLLTKDLLRTLFILEGFTCRHDLERQMDWGRKGRALVYERGTTSEPAPSSTRQSTS
jgi:2-polyprenyl-3-methyl-5-hydroxy-6-metoxy-1,4-benzoquinol methylase